MIDGLCRRGLFQQKDLRIALRPNGFRFLWLRLHHLVDELPTVYALPAATHVAVRERLEKPYPDGKLGAAANAKGEALVRCIQRVVRALHSRPSDCRSAFCQCLTLL